MTNLDEKLSNIIKILSDIETIIHRKRNFESINDLLRSLNFEANEFFENLTPEFNVANISLEKILTLIHDIITNLNNSDKTAFDLKINLLNLQIYIPIHLLFVLTSNNLSFQFHNQSYLEKLVHKIHFFEETPVFEFGFVTTLDQKIQLENYLRIYGSLGDLYYLLCSNLSIIKQENLIEWSNKCFRQFFLLDKALEKFNPLDFYIINKLDVEDFYREIIGHYTILGNTNATNLLENLIGINNPTLLAKIDFGSYINSPDISELEKKLEIKAQKIKSLISKVEQTKKNNIFFPEQENPLSIISFKLMLTLEKYFDFSLSKVRAYQKEFNQLLTPASNELKTCLTLCEEWIERALDLTENNENILDTPFGGLFNSVFLDYLLLLALDDGKTIKETLDKKPSLEEKLDKYHHIFTEGNHSLEQISDFIYYKTYAQIYIYCCKGDLETITNLEDELQSFLEYLDNRPFLKVNSLCLILYLEKIVNSSNSINFSKFKNKLLETTGQKSALQHLQKDITFFISSLENNGGLEPFTDEKISKRLKANVLDINSWLIPYFNFKSVKSGLKFISFNLMSDRVI